MLDTRHNRPIPHPPTAPPHPQPSLIKIFSHPHPRPKLRSPIYHNSKPPSPPSTPLSTHRKIPHSTPQSLNPLNPMQPRIRTHLPTHHPTTPQPSPSLRSQSPKDALPPPSGPRTGAPAVLPACTRPPQHRNDGSALAIRDEGRGDSLENALGDATLEVGVRLCVETMT